MGAQQLRTGHVGEGRPSDVHAGQKVSAYAQTRIGAAFQAV